MYKQNECSWANPEIENPSLIWQLRIFYSVVKRALSVQSVPGIYHDRCSFKPHCKLCWSFESTRSMWKDDENVPKRHEKRSDFYKSESVFLSFLRLVRNFNITIHGGNAAEENQTACHTCIVILIHICSFKVAFNSSGKYLWLVNTLASDCAYPRTCPGNHSRRSFHSNEGLGLFAKLRSC